MAQRGIRGTPSSPVWIRIQGLCLLLRDPLVWFLHRLMSVDRKDHKVYRVHKVPLVLKVLTVLKVFPVSLVPVVLKAPRGPVVPLVNRALRGQQVCRGPRVCGEIREIEATKAIQEKVVCPVRKGLVARLGHKVPEAYRASKALRGCKVLKVFRARRATEA